MLLPARVGASLSAHSVQVLQVRTAPVSDPPYPKGQVFAVKCENRVHACLQLLHQITDLDCLRTQSVHSGNLHNDCRIQAKEKEATEKSEKLAEEADVDGSQLFAQQAEAFARQHEALLKQFQQPERTMSVCDVCGVFINSTDNDQRRAVIPSVSPGSL